jgi:hypothetical protein
MDKKLITEVGKQFLLEFAIGDQFLKENLTFKEHVKLCGEIMTLDYEGVATVFSEDIREFEGKFSKFLKYGLAGVAGATLGLKAAGLKVGLLKAPGLAMFALYLFRKATDPCERACFRTMPMSAKRDACKLECKVDAARQLVNELRSEIAKCRQFTNPPKCEKKLMKQYIRWSKKLQELLIKLRAVKAGQVQKVRKIRGKELSKRAKALSASANISTSRLAKLISESEEVRNRLTFKEHLYLYNSVKKKVIEEELKAPKTKPITQKILSVGLVTAAAVIPLPGLVLAMVHLTDANIYKCAVKCAKLKNEEDKVYCHKRCKLMGIQWTISYIEGERRKCSGKKKGVIKCEEKLRKLVRKWKLKEIEAKIRLDTYKRKKGIR